MKWFQSVLKNELKRDKKPKNLQDLKPLLSLVDSLLLRSNNRPLYKNETGT